MKKLTALLAGALILAIAVPAFAGEGHYEKCTADAQTCLDKMATKLQNKGYMGLEFAKAEDGQYSIKEVVAGAPAATAGFKAGDVILVINGAEWSDETAMQKLDWSPGSKMAVKVQRGEAKKTLNITLGKMPEEVMARMLGAHMLSDHVAAAASEEGHKH